MTFDQRNGIALATGAATLVGGSVAASSLLSGYPVLGGQAVRYAIAAALLALWARLRRRHLPRVTCADALWLSLLAAFGLAGCSVAQIEATRLSDPAVVGVVIGAAPVLIAVLAPAMTRRHPSGRVLIAAGIVVAGSAATQIGSAAGHAPSPAGAAATISALAGVAATSLLAGPVLPRLGALAMSAYACGLAAAQLLLLAAGFYLARGTPILTVPTAAQAAALAYLAVINAVVLLAWYSAVQKLGVERAGLFNGVIPMAALAAVSAVGTGTVSGLQAAGAAAVAMGILAGLTEPRADRKHQADTAASKRPPSSTGPNAPADRHPA